MHRALTICQPWAWAIFHAGKRYENRRWATNYRGPLLIHAGKSTEWLERGTAALARLGVAVQAELAYGAILGEVELVDCLPVRDVPRDPHASGPYCFELYGPRELLAPIVFRGAQGIFGVPERVMAAAQWRDAGEARTAWGSVEKIRTTCACGHALLILISGAELAIYARFGEEWQRVQDCPMCERSFAAATIDRIKGGIWQS